jgi:hypothetical protein
MAPSVLYRAARWPIPAIALATLTLGPSPSVAQTVYREYDDGRIETFSPQYGRGGYAAPLRRPPPRDFDDDDADERFERDERRSYGDRERDDDDFDGRQGQLDFAPEPARKPPAPPPSMNAKPEEKAWKPAL